MKSIVKMAAAGLLFVGVTGATAAPMVDHHVVVTKRVVTTRHIVRRCHTEWRHHHRVRVCR